MINPISIRTRFKYGFVKTYCVEFGSGHRWITKYSFYERPSYEFKTNTMRHAAENHLEACHRLQQEYCDRMNPSPLIFDPFDHPLTTADDF
jgi:hypothetical protein